MVRWPLTVVLLALAGCGAGEGASSLLVARPEPTQRVLTTDMLAPRIGCTHIARLLNDQNAPLSEVLRRQADCPPDGTPGWLVVRDEAAFENYQAIGLGIRGVRAPAQPAPVARVADPGPANPPSAEPSLPLAVPASTAATPAAETRPAPVTGPATVTLRRPEPVPAAPAVAEAPPMAPQAPPAVLTTPRLPVNQTIAPSGTVSVQLGAVPSEAAARTEQDRLNHLLRDLLNGRIEILRPARESQSTMLRLRLGNFRDADAAQRFCDVVRERQVPCSVIGGTIRIQLGTLPTEEAAHSEASRLARRYGDLLGTVRLQVQRIQRDDAEPIFRLIAGPFTSPAAASALCDQMRERRVPCRLIRG